MKDGLISLQSMILEHITVDMIESCDYTVSTVDCDRDFFPRVIDIVTNTGYLTEWLRWWTRNPLGNSRVGSNPAVVGDNGFRQNYQHRRVGPGVVTSRRNIPAATGGKQEIAGGQRSRAVETYLLPLEGSRR